MLSKYTTDDFPKLNLSYSHISLNKRLHKKYVETSNTDNFINLRRTS
jgi:hypothetical protein